MEDEPDVGPVDAHAEGDRGDDQVTFAGPESVVGGLPLASVEVARLVPVGGPVAHGPVSEFLELGGQLIDLLAGRAIDDPGLPAAPVEDVQDLVEHLVSLEDAVNQVGPIEVAD